jgi:hypothetical protein
MYLLSSSCTGSYLTLTTAPFGKYSRSREIIQDDTPISSTPTFPAKMHAILSDKEISSVIEWCPHGRAWRILKPRIFEIHVLPKYFDHSKLSSFVRQANGWGFRRLTQGYDRNAYYHEWFLRGKPELVKQMKRPKVGEKKSADPEYEPDLHAIDMEHPLDGNAFSSEQDSMNYQPTQVMSNSTPGSISFPQALPQEMQHMIADNTQFAAGFLAAQARGMSMNGHLYR